MTFQIQIEPYSRCLKEEEDLCLTRAQTPPDPLTLVTKVGRVTPTPTRTARPTTTLAVVMASTSKH